MKFLQMQWISNLKNRECSIFKYYFGMQEKSVKKKCMYLESVFEKVTYIRKNVYVFSKEFSYLMSIIKIMCIE